MVDARAVVFDLDDTLYPEVDYARSGLRHCGAWLERHEGMWGAAASLLALLDEGRRDRLFDAVLEARGRHDPALVRALVARYRTHPPKIRLYSDVLPALRRLRAAGVRLGLLTDGWLHQQQAKIDALGIRPMFDAVVCTDAMGREAWKPSPAGYARVERELGLRAGALVYVGDNEEKDFVTARARGWLTVRVARRDAYRARGCPSPAHRAHATIEGLEELIDTLEALGWNIARNAGRAP